MARKVMTGEELLRAAGTVTKKLAKWMAANGYLDAAQAGGRPGAERLFRLLDEHA